MRQEISVSNEVYKLLVKRKADFLRLKGTFSDFLGLLVRLIQSLNNEINLKQALT